MRSFRLMALLAMCLMLLAAPVQAKTTITFWHGMGGELGEITDEMIKEFNASQDKYEVKGVYKGNYDEAMTAAIAAFRAKQHPNLIQIFEVGTASMMAAKGAIRPVYEIMEAAGTPVDIKDVAYDVLRHRIFLNFEALSDGVNVEDIISELLKEEA